jgi:hypothetical protein
MKKSTSSISYLILFLICLLILLFFLYKAKTNKPFEQSKTITDQEDQRGTSLNVSINATQLTAILNKYYRNDIDAFDIFEEKIKNIFNEQMYGTIIKKPMCLDKINPFNDEKPESINRVEGFIDEITSVCHKAKMLYWKGKEWVRLISDEEFNEYTTKLWDKYFYSQKQLQYKIDQEIEEFIARVEDNHQDMLINVKTNVEHQLEGLSNLSSSLYKNTTLELSNFVQRQSLYITGLGIAGIGTGYFLEKWTASFIKKFRFKGKSFYSAIALMLISLLSDFFNDNVTIENLEQSIYEKLMDMQDIVMYGSENEPGLITILSNTLNKYQVQEKENILNEVIKIVPVK